MHINEVIVGYSFEIKYEQFYLIFQKNRFNDEFGYLYMIKYWYLQRDSCRYSLLKFFSSFFKVLLLNIFILLFFVKTWTCRSNCEFMVCGGRYMNTHLPVQASNEWMCYSLFTCRYIYCLMPCSSWLLRSAVIVMKCHLLKRFLFLEWWSVFGGGCFRVSDKNALTREN